jgi:hypothetical protein
MNGFLHYFLSSLNPMVNLGFSRALPELMRSELLLWWFVFFLSFVLLVLPSIITWLFYLLKPASIRPPLPVRPNQAQPLVTLVIAGRNESATIGECIRAALLCGYSNLEVVFVDDNSEDNSVAIARRAALTATGQRRDAERVRIFPSPRRNGKPSSLSIGIRMARGEFIAITDADSIIQYGSVQHWLLPFDNPRVGAVSANVRVNNSTVNLLTRLQEVEYALKFSMGRFTMARLDLLNIISGMGGLFRAEILHRLGGFDSVSALFALDDGPRAVCRNLRAVSDRRQAPLCSRPRLGGDPMVVRLVAQRDYWRPVRATIVLVGLAVAPAPAQSAGPVPSVFAPVGSQWAHPDAPETYGGSAVGPVPVTPGFDPAAVAFFSLWSYGAMRAIALITAGIAQSVNVVFIRHNPDRAHVGDAWLRPHRRRIDQ